MCPLWVGPFWSALHVLNQDHGELLYTTLFSCSPYTGRYPSSLIEVHYTVLNLVPWGTLIHHCMFVFPLSSLLGPHLVRAYLTFIGLIPSPYEEPFYSRSLENLAYYARINPKVQPQLETSFPPANSQDANGRTDRRWQIQ